MIHLRGLAFDLKKPPVETTFQRALKVEKFYEGRLRGVAKNVADLIAGFDAENTDSVIWITNALREYARILEPWAGSVGWRMIEETKQRDESNWNLYARKMGVALRKEIAGAPVGAVMRRMLFDQVGLITSIPRDAAQRVHDMAQEGIIQGTRPKEIAARILETGRVTTARATLIARTEVARTASVLTQVRAQHIGCTTFQWVTAGDSNVRPSHKKLNRKTFRYDDPPISDPPDYRSLPGQIWNCFPESTKVSLTNGCNHIWRYWHEGALIRIEHEAGLFEATPNHPILTRRGWIAAKDLQTSDHVIQSLNDRAAAFDDDEHEGQPTLGDLFAALDVGLSRETHLGLLFDFHGDRPSNDVDQIRADLLLKRYGKAGGLKSDRDLAFSGADRGMVEPSVRGALNISVARSPSSGAEFGAILNAHRLHPADVSLRGASAYDAMFFEDSRNGYPAPAESIFNRNGEFAHSVPLVVRDDIAFRKVVASIGRRAALGGRPYRNAASMKVFAESGFRDANITTDRGDTDAASYKALRVINHTVRSFAGHVFTIESETGWFSISAAGIITKNCRCLALPQLED